MLICGCTPNVKKEESQDIVFQSLDDSELQDYVIDTLYSGINANFSNEDYIIENIATTYVSKEYLEELDYNSKSNIYFGFTLDEINELFQGKKYVFDVDENNETTVVEFKEYQNPYKKMLKNVAIGSGVIIVCTTVSVVSGGTVSIIFAASAKTATEFALTSAGFSAFISSAIEYYKTGDIEKSIEKGLVDGSEGFKWGAIIGGTTGGVTETITQLKAAKDIKVLSKSQRGAKSELRAQKKYGGKDQVSYLNGKEVSMNEYGATRPDLVRNVNGKLEAIEVKNYNLDLDVSREHLYEELQRQVTSRVNNLPKGSTQRIVLDVQGRNYSKSRINEVIDGIRNACKEVYPNIPIDIMT